MHSKQMMAILTVLAVVLMGTAMVGSVAAAGEDDASPVLKVEAGGSVLTYPTEDGIVTMPTLEDVASFYQVPADEVFVSWIEKDGSAVYMPGQQYTLADDLTVVPNTKAATDIVFEVDGTAYSVAFTDADSLTIPAEATKAIESMTGQHFVGWSYDGKTYKTIEEIREIPGLGAGAIFVAILHESYDVTWIVDGITIATGTTEDLSKPIDPTKDHYTFAGWYDASGVKYTDAYVIDADTVFTAKFDPVMYAVTFEAGDYSAVVYVPYGQCATPLALPEGYESWDYDFGTPITGDLTITAVASAEPEPTYWTVTLTVDGETYMVLTSDKLPASIAAPVKEGYDFTGWMVQGQSTYIDPLHYEYTADTVLVAAFSESVPEEPGFWSTGTGIVVAILVAIVLVGVLAAMYLKRDEIRSGLVKKLDKTKKEGE